MSAELPQLVSRIEPRLARLYGEGAADLAERIAAVAARHRSRIRSRDGGLWNQADMVLITYGDQVRAEGATPLAALGTFLHDAGLEGKLSAVHILPFSPYSSDDGFSVIDYRQVDPALGDWDDVARLGTKFDLAFDLVLNHASAQSQWFADYLAGKEPYTRYFVEGNPKDDLSGVTRPRSLPLLTEFETSRGPRHLWTTFSADQIDLNFSDADLLVEMIDILLDYVARGARIIRLDAIAYLWKQVGTTCIHLPETHEVVKLFRDLFDEVAPGTILLTETNVPHAENVSYLGDGDEAHMIYQFSLSPLLLDAFLNEDATALQGWLNQLEALPAGTTYFNFTASHDGIGVRPAEGLLPPERIMGLADQVRRRGGHVNTRRKPDGTDSPYELNITYFDALSDPDQPDASQHAARFLASQAIMLSLQGIPGIYFHSLVGTPNYIEGVARTGQNRTINRRKFDRAELDAVLADEHSAARQVFDGYRELITRRIEQPAFHPDAKQQVLAQPNAALLAFDREAAGQGQRIRVVANLSGSEQSITGLLEDFGPTNDLISGQMFSADGTCHLAPWQVVWLAVA